jgi:hypothetical protein
MSKIIQELIQFFSIKDSVSTGLDSYITSKNPQSVSEVERLARIYMDRGICGRL